MLTLKNKTPVRFEWTDELSETAVTLSPDDDSETIAAKLQRILDLEQGNAAYLARLETDALELPVRQPGAALEAARAEFEPLLDMAGMEAAAARVGWEALAGGDGAENLPEY